MSSYAVKELMVPLSEYATVREGATLFEAVMALEKAQEEYDHTQYRHRAVLVLDKDDRVIGKVSHMDVLNAVEIEPDISNFYKLSELRDFDFSDKFINSLIKVRPRRGITLRDLCQKASNVRVETIMQKPTEEEHVAPDTELESAIHQMAMGHYLSLLVFEGKEIVGILRLSDVFGAIFHTMKECENNKE